MTVATEFGIGPADPGSPMGELTVFQKSCNAVLKFQAFEDGVLWQLQVLKGSPYGELVGLLEAVASGGVWMDVFNPEDVDEEDPNFYISVWVRHIGGSRSLSEAA